VSWQSTHSPLTPCTHTHMHTHTHAHTCIISCINNGSMHMTACVTMPRHSCMCDCGLELCVVVGDETRWLIRAVSHSVLVTECCSCCDVMWLWMWGWRRNVSLVAVSRRRLMSGRLPSRSGKCSLAAHIRGLGCLVTRSVVVRVVDSVVYRKDNCWAVLVHQIATSVDCHVWIVQCWNAIGDTRQSWPMLPGLKDCFVCDWMTLVRNLCYYVNTAFMLQYSNSL